VTPVFAVFVTVAVNFWLAPAASCTEAGVIFTVTCCTIVTVAALDLVLSATDVAITFTNEGLGGVVGAVYRPPGVTVPQVAPAQPRPVTLQVTAVLLLPVTDALNCCVAPPFISTLSGEIITLTCGVDETIVTVVLPDIDGFERDCAVINTAAGLGTLVGAV
jgi:hypothetical protein